jgi:peptide subunit release factor 1 (eRF1)
MRVLAVVLDRAHARFFDVSADATVELPSLASPAIRGGKFHSDRQGGPGWGEHAYHGRVREEERRHLTAVTERLAAFERDHPDTDVLVAGPGTAAGALRRALPPTLGQRVIGTAKLSPLEVTPAVVHRTATQLRAAHQRAVQRALVAAVLEGLGTGRAETGVRAVLRALAQGQVRTLLVRADVRGTGFRCGESGRLVLSATDCPGEGNPMPVADVFQAAADEARRQGARVTLLDDSDVAQPIEGLAALLRWP